MAGISDINVSNWLTLTVDGVEVTDVQTISGGGSNANIIEIRHYNEEFAKKLVGSKSVDPFEVTCSYVPSTASYKALALLAKSNEAVECKLTLKGGASAAQGSQDLKFTGIISSKSISTEYDAGRTVTYSIAVSGGITETDGV